MLSWCKTQRAAVLFGVGGVLLVALLVSRLVPAAGNVKKAARPLSIPGPTQPQAAQAPAPVVPPPPSVYAPPPPPMTSPVPVPSFPTPTAAPAPDLTGKTIDQLLNDLDALRAQKGDLEGQEKKLLGVLKMKLADQDERLRKHGLSPAGMAPCCNVPSAVVPAPVVSAN
jgi:hypothetical protein